MGDIEGNKDIKREAGFEKLWIWQEANALALEIAKTCKLLPSEERYRLRHQIESSSSSVQDNIAEGYSAYYFNDKIKGMYTARKEAGETQNHIRKMEARKYIGSDKANEWVQRYEKVIIGINSFNKYILEKRDRSSRKGSRVT